MLGVWPASYVNYVPTNDLVMVARFWRPGRSLRIRRKDDEAANVLRELFPGREIVQVHPENVNPRRWRDELHHPAAAGEHAVRAGMRLGEGSGRCPGDKPLRQIKRWFRTGQNSSADEIC